MKGAGRFNGARSPESTPQVRQETQSRSASLRPGPPVPALTQPGLRPTVSCPAPGDILQPHVRAWVAAPYARICRPVFLYPPAGLRVLASILPPRQFWARAAFGSRRRYLGDLPSTFPRLSGLEMLTANLARCHRRSVCFEENSHISFAKSRFCARKRTGLKNS